MDFRSFWCYNKKTNECSSYSALDEQHPTWNAPLCLIHLPPQVRRDCGLEGILFWGGVFFVWLVLSQR